MKRKPGHKPATITEYLTAVPPDKRAALQRLRKAVRATAPGAEECISYGIPAFRLDGRVLVYFAAAKNHCSFFPGGIIEGFEDELEGYETSKGTVRFTPDHPLPVALIRKLVKAAMARNAARRDKR
jgi:uncharacterized protein YdhG (YjbR/CyaY superfamily)